MQTLLSISGQTQSLDWSNLLWNILYAPNVANLRFWKIGPIFTSQVRQFHYNTEKMQVWGIRGCFQHPPIKMTINYFSLYLEYTDYKLTGRLEPIKNIQWVVEAFFSQVMRFEVGMGICRLGPGLLSTKLKVSCKTLMSK